MTLLPDVIRADSGFTPRQLQGAVRDQQRAELAIFRYALSARVEAECDIIDSHATADAFRAALETEVELLDYGLRLANGSAAKAELVARNMEMFVAAQSRRISRRFGG